jgi:hypothetical protein
MIHGGHHAASGGEIQLCFSGGGGFCMKSLAVAGENYSPVPRDLDRFSSKQNLQSGLWAGSLHALLINLCL